MQHWLMQVALDLFEAEWAELIGQPSTISADEEAQVWLVQPASLACSHMGKGSRLPVVKINPGKTRCGCHGEALQQTY